MGDQDPLKLIGQSEPTDVLSNISKGGEWVDRPIHLWGVVRSFISQLKVGQSITKVSLPAELCYPYSILELLAHRKLSFFNILYDLGQGDRQDGMGRFLTVLKYFLCLARSTTQHKKPWNPILGETHKAYLVDDVYGGTEFISEQVSHHPPASAYHITNEKLELNIQGTLSFSVAYSGNSVSIMAMGEQVIKFDKWNEQYIFNRPLPDLVVRNVVIGRKYMVWCGNNQIRCPETGFCTKIVFSVDWMNNNLVSGTIWHESRPDEILYKFKGKCNGRIMLTPASKNKTKTLLVDLDIQKPCQITYLPLEKLDVMSSVIVWDKANYGIIVNDMTIADHEKYLVEDKQRKNRLIMDDNQSPCQYFEKNDNEQWVLKPGISSGGILSEEIQTVSITKVEPKGRTKSFPDQISEKIPNKFPKSRSETTI